MPKSEDPLPWNETELEQFAELAESSDRVDADDDSPSELHMVTRTQTADTDRITAVILEVVGEIDLSNAEAFQERIEETFQEYRQPAIPTADAPRLILDLIGVHYVDSAALAVLVVIYRLAQGNPAFRDGIEICTLPSSFVSRALRLTRLDKLFLVTDSVATAVS